MDAGMRMSKLADAVGNVGNLSGLGYAETRKRLLDAVTGITRDALDSYRPFLNESRIQSIAEPMEDGKRLPAGYRKKVNPMFVTAHARAGNLVLLSRRRWSDRSGRWRSIFPCSRIPRRTRYC